MDFKPSRRGFLIGMGAVLATPAIVRATSLDFIPRERVPKVVWRRYHSYRAALGDGRVVDRIMMGTVYDTDVNHVVFSTEGDFTSWKSSTPKVHILNSLRNLYEMERIQARGIRDEKVDKLLGYC